MSDELTQDIEVGIRVGCEFCSWKSESYPYGQLGEQQANDELAHHQMDKHPRGEDDSRLPIYSNE